MRIFFDIQQAIYLALAIAVLILQLTALVDIAQRPASQIDAVSRQPKNVWLIVLGVLTALNVLSLPGINVLVGLGMFVLMGVTPALHWMLSIRSGIGQNKHYRAPGGGGW